MSIFQALQAQPQVRIEWPAKQVCTGARSLPNCRNISANTVTAPSKVGWLVTLIENHWSKLSPGTILEWCIFSFWKVKTDWFHAFIWHLANYIQAAHVDLSNCFLLCVLVQICAATIDLGDIQICGIQMAKAMIKPLQQVSSDQQNS